MKRTDVITLADGSTVEVFLELLDDGTLRRTVTPPVSPRRVYVEMEFPPDAFTDLFDE